MFEEIKGMLASIEKKLNERVSVKENHSSTGTVTEPKSDVKTNTVKPEQLLQLIATYLQNSEQKIGKVSESVRESEKHVLSHMEDLKRITISQKPDSKVRHYHVVDWRSNKVVITIVCLSVLLLTSLFGNFQQFIVNSRITDNDLKYRYIKSTNGISPENLNKLEDIFQYNRDKKLIREIRKKVQEFEQNLKESSLRIERNQKSGQDQNTKPNLR
jgi:hypothetical protein